MTKDGHYSKKLLPLPIKPEAAIKDIIKPALEMLPGKMNTPEAVVLMVAIALQESGLAYRRQIKGPARGLWQFEKSGGVKGVMEHKASETLSKLVCHRLNVTPLVPVVYDTLEHNDLLAASYARLLLWTDARSLPRVGDAEGGWDCYIRNWRPGKPHRNRWDANYKKALESFID